jgi:hypothetical protein
VREALEFSGRLRLSADIPRAEQDRFIKVRGRRMRMRMRMRMMMMMM